MPQESFLSCVLYLQLNFGSKIKNPFNFLSVLYTSVLTNVNVKIENSHERHASCFVNPGKTIASENYAQQINEIHQILQCLQPALVNRKGPILPQDNARPHIAQSTL